MHNVVDQWFDWPCTFVPATRTVPFYCSQVQQCHARLLSCLLPHLSSLLSRGELCLESSVFLFSLSTMCLTSPSAETVEVEAFVEVNILDLKAFALNIGILPCCSSHHQKCKSGRKKLSVSNLSLENNLLMFQLNAPHLSTIVMNR